MESEFWHDKWRRNDIGFHNSEVHPLLPQYWPLLKLAQESRVLVPLAGKSLDIDWLLAQGHTVTAAELSEVAVTSFFSERGWRPFTTDYSRHRRYRCDNLDFWVGDFLTLADEAIEPFDAVYDRAALIALPATMRSAYVEALGKLMKTGARYLLISLEYPRSASGGPPFAIDEDTIRHLFDPGFSIQTLGRHPAEVKAQPCTECVYLLQRR